MERNLVGRRVREGRVQATPRVTQVELAARLEVRGLKISQAAISKIENGTRPVSDVEVAALAEALGVSAGWLLSER